MVIRVSLIKDYEKQGFCLSGMQPLTDINQEL
jgi:hypothetical protein